MYVRYDSSGELSLAFFTPQETTTYVLWFEADNEGELFFGTNANISNVTRYMELTVTVAVMYRHGGSGVKPLLGRLNIDTMTIGFPQAM